MNGPHSTTPDLNERDGAGWLGLAGGLPGRYFLQWDWPKEVTDGPVSPGFLTDKTLEHFSPRYQPGFTDRSCSQYSTVWPAIVRLDDLAEMDLILTWRIMNGWESTQWSLRSLLLTAARSPRGPPSSCQSPLRFDLRFPQPCQIRFRTLGNDYFIKNDLIIIVLALYRTKSCWALFPRVLLTTNPPQSNTPTNLSTFYIFPFIQFDTIIQASCTRMIKILTTQPRYLLIVPT